MGGLCGVLCTGMTFVTLLYTIMGFFGYLVFGSQVSDSGSITIVLPRDEAVANSARIISSVAILLTNPLQGSVQKYTNLITKGGYQRVSYFYAYR